MAVNGRVFWFKLVLKQTLCLSIRKEVKLQWKINTALLSTTSPLCRTSITQRRKGTTLLGAAHEIREKISLAKSWTKADLPLLFTLLMASTTPSAREGISAPGPGASWADAHTLLDASLSVHGRGENSEVEQQSDKRGSSSPRQPWEQ